MYQPIIMCIGFRFFLRKNIMQLYHFITYFSISTITLGVMSLIIILSIMNGFEKELEKKLLSFVPHILLTTQIGNIHCNDCKKPLFKKEKDIQKISPIVTSEIILQSSNNISVGTILGINPMHFQTLSKFIIHGSITQLIPKKYYAIIGATLAEQLKIKIGDNVRIILPNVTKITPIGNVPTQRIFKIIDIYITNTDIDSYQLLTHQEDAARLMHYPPKHVTGWGLWIKEPLKINSFTKIQHQSHDNNIIQKDWRERQGNIFKILHIEKNMMGLLLSSIILISGFNIIAFSCLLVTEKKKTLLF